MENASFLLCLSCVRTSVDLAKSKNSSCGDSQVDVKAFQR